jgi:shikimate 5-dehydrogenase
LPLDRIQEAHGDIIINASRIGSSVADEYFSEEVVSKFGVVVDVTFGNENTNLIQLGKSSGPLTVTGWEMFTQQAAVVLREILGHEANIERLHHFVSLGLTKINHGATVRKKHSR